MKEKIESLINEFIEDQVGPNVACGGTLFGVNEIVVRRLEPLDPKRDNSWSVSEWDEMADELIEIIDRKLNVKYKVVLHGPNGFTLHTEKII